MRKIANDLAVFRFMREFRNIAGCHDKFMYFRDKLIHLCFAKVLHQQQADVRNLSVKQNFISYIYLLRLQIDISMDGRIFGNQSLFTSRGSPLFLIVFIRKIYLNIFCRKLYIRI